MEKFTRVFDSAEKRYIITASLANGTITVKTQGGVLAKFTLEEARMLGLNLTQAADHIKEYGES